MRQFLRDVPAVRTTGPQAPDELVTQLLADCERRQPLADNNATIEALTLYRLHGDYQARDRIVSSNIRLVVKMGHSYVRERPDLRLSDLVQEGVIGFMRGLDKFDFAYLSNGPVANYALTWSRREMKLYMDQVAPAVRISDRVVRAASKAMKLRNEYVKEFEWVGIPLDMVLDIMGHTRSDRVGSLEVYGTVQSLDAPMDNRYYNQEDHFGNGSSAGFGSAGQTGRLSYQMRAPGPEHNWAEQLEEQCRVLEPEQRQLLYAFYEVGTTQEDAFEQLCRKVGLSISEGVAKVQQCIAQLQQAQRHPRHPVSPR